MPFYEKKDPETGKAPKHQAAALKAAGRSISNAEIVPDEDEPLEGKAGFTAEETKEIEDACEDELRDEEPLDEVRGPLYKFDDSDWLIFEDYGIAERQAVEYVGSMLEDEPESFNQQWLQNYITMSDTDRRGEANDESRNYAYEQLDEDEAMKESGLDDRNAEIEEDIDFLLSEIKALEKEKNDPDDDNIVNVVDDEISIKTDRIEALEKEQTELPDEAREKIQEDKYDEIYEELDDPIQYFVEDHMMYTAEQLLDVSFISINIDEAAQDAVNEDGIAHFLAGYDGNVLELDNGMVMYRVN